MTEKNDYFYVCSLIEHIARKTVNRRKTVVRALGEKGLEKQLYYQNPSYLECSYRAGYLLE